MNGSKEPKSGRNAERLVSVKDQTTTDKRIEEAGSEDLFDADDDNVSDEASCMTASDKRHNYSTKENKLIADTFGSFITASGTIKEDKIFK